MDRHDEAMQKYMRENNIGAMQCAAGCNHVLQENTIMSLKNNIEIIENKQENNSIKYCLKDHTLVDKQEKIYSRLVKLDQENYFSNRELIKELVEFAVTTGFEAGKRYGKEKIVYKEINNERENQTSTYQGTDGGRNRKVY